MSHAEPSVLIVDDERVNIDLMVVRPLAQAAQHKVARES